MEPKIDTEALRDILSDAVGQDLSIQVNIHGVEDLQDAIEACTNILGGPNAAHDKVRISQQPSCFCVSAIAGKVDVTFFVSKK
jgi:hypothetical protein